MQEAVKPWSKEKAAHWAQAQPWLAGCNFIPSTAINQLEMWQAQTFDPATLDRELGWAAGLGFNAVRVYLHDLLWLQDAPGFKDRMRRYLDIAARHGLCTIFVLFDDCWHDNPALGPQPAPDPGIHNSGWLRSPGSKVLRDPGAWGRLEEYVCGVVSAFGKDPRVLLWDVYNEPGNGFLISLRQPRLAQALKLLGLLGRYFLLPLPSRPLLEKAFSWARQAGPSQPLTSATWYLREHLESRLNLLAVERSDVISFHSYFNLEITARLVAKLSLAGRPLLCTEYLARKAGSNFITHLPFFRQHTIGCLNWGLVDGKTQTRVAWDEYLPGGGEPPLWFHDILRTDGSPYRQEEVDFLRTFLARKD